MKHKFTHVRLADNGIEPTEENIERLEFWGRTTSGEEIRLYVLDEDKPVPSGYEEAEFENLEGILPVTFFVKTDT